VLRCRYSHMFLRNMLVFDVGGFFFSLVLSDLKIPSHSSVFFNVFTFEMYSRKKGKKVAELGQPIVFGSLVISLRIQNVISL
jgi:hypothetical protein